MTKRHASAPFGAVRANYPEGLGVPEVQIINPSGGILGGDRLLRQRADPGREQSVQGRGSSGEEASQETTIRTA